MARRLANAFHRTAADSARSSNAMDHLDSRTISSFSKLQIRRLSLKHRPSLIVTQGRRSSEDDDQICDLLEDPEDLEQYRPGSLHPIQLGDRLCHGRYEIIHKLGYGSYSTVWLANDHFQQITPYIAIKIVQAQASSSQQEVQCLQRLLAGPAEHPGRSYISPLDDAFSIQGSNGHHLCLVMPVAGCCLYDCKLRNTSMFKADPARAIVAWILPGLLHIHSRGVIPSFGLDG